MPGPTTEVLNEDIKELKAEIRDIRSDMATLRADVHAIAVGMAEFRVFMRVATWGGALLVTTSAAGIWWAATLSGDVRQVKEAVGKLETRVGAVESKLATPAPGKVAKGE